MNSTIIKNSKLVYGGYNLRIEQIRLLSWILSNVNSEKDEFEFIKLDLIKYKKLTGNSYKSYDSIYKNINAINKMYIKLYEPFTQKLSNIKIFDTFFYGGGNKRNILNVKLSDDLRPYLLKVDEKDRICYTLKDVFKLNNKHTLHFYEIIKSLDIRQSVQEFYFSIDEVKRILDIEEQYSEHRNIKTNILKAVKQDLEKNTEYLLDYTSVFCNRLLIGYKFKFHKKLKEKENYCNVTTERLKQYSDDEESKYNIKHIVDSANCETEKAMKEIISKYKNYKLNELHNENYEIDELLLTYNLSSKDIEILLEDGGYDSQLLYKYLRIAKEENIDSSSLFSYLRVNIKNEFNKNYYITTMSNITSIKDYLYQDQKILLKLLLKKINDNENIYVINVEDFKEITDNYQNITYRSLKETLKQFEIFPIRLILNNGRDETTIPWFVRTQYYDTNENIKVEISAQVKLLLTKLNYVF